MFSRIQNLHISQTIQGFQPVDDMFSRIQNLHISQTPPLSSCQPNSLVEFKIYISLKQNNGTRRYSRSLVEFKIYISLKRVKSAISDKRCLVEFKIYISLKLLFVHRI